MEDTKKEKSDIYKNAYDDLDLPDAPKLEIYQETFGGLKNVTDEWYKK